MTFINTLNDNAVVDDDHFEPPWEADRLADKWAQIAGSKMPTQAGRFGVVEIVTGTIKPQIEAVALPLHPHMNRVELGIDVALQLPHVSGSLVDATELLPKPISYRDEIVKRTARHNRRFLRRRKQRKVSSEAENSTAKEAEPAVGFRASKKLLDVWLDGLNSIREEAGEPRIEVGSQALRDEYAAELVREVEKVISNYSYHKSFKEKRLMLTIGGRFSNFVENLFADNLMLPPRPATNFCDELVSLIISQSKQGSVLNWQWAKVVVDQTGEIALELAKRKRQTLAEFIKK